MNIVDLSIDAADIRKLLSAASGDAALLYLYLRSGNDASAAEQALHMSASRLSCAGATLRQLGLWQQEQQRPGCCVVCEGLKPN